MFCTCCGEKLKTKKGQCRICKQPVLPLKDTNGYFFVAPKVPEKKR